MKHCCRNCHFLARTDYFENGVSHTFTWSKEEREEGEPKYPEISAASCWRGIWDTGVNPELNTRLEEVIDKNRKNRCFFVEYDEDGMLFDGALELFKARNERRDRKQNVYFGVAGIVVGIAGIAVALVLSKDFRDLVKEIIDGLSLYVPVYPI